MAGLGFSEKQSPRQINQYGIIIDIFHLKLDCNITDFFQIDILVYGSGSMLAHI